MLVAFDFGLTNEQNIGKPSFSLEVSTNNIKFENKSLNGINNKQKIIDNLETNSKIQIIQLVNHINNAVYKLYKDHTFPLQIELFLMSAFLKQMVLMLFPFL